MNQISVARLFEEKRDAFELEQLTDSLESKVPITVSDINRPGLAMAGYVENFLSERVQVIGETEIGLLATYDEEMNGVVDMGVPMTGMLRSLARRRSPAGTARSLATTMQGTWNVNSRSRAVCARCGIWSS